MTHLKHYNAHYNCAIPEHRLWECYSQISQDLVNEWEGANVV
jgi:hypothetical protein